jgi:hypothetical protein
MFSMGRVFPATPRKEPYFSHKVMRLFYLLIKLMGKNTTIKSTDPAVSLFTVGLHGTDREIIENNDILRFPQRAQLVCNKILRSSGSAAMHRRNPCWFIP